MGEGIAGEVGGDMVADSGAGAKDEERAGARHFWAYESWLDGGDGGRIWNADLVGTRGRRYGIVN